MSLRRDAPLGGEDRPAGRALRPVRQTRLRAGGGVALHGHGPVTLRRDRPLRRLPRPAGRALRPIRQARLRAGGGIALHGLPAVPRRRDRLLRGDPRVAGRALRPVRQAGLGAGRRGGGDDRGPVAQRGHDLLRGDLAAAHGALAARRQAGAGAGRRDRVERNRLAVADGVVDLGRLAVLNDRLRGARLDDEALAFPAQRRIAVKGVLCDGLHAGRYRHLLQIRAARERLRPDGGDAVRQRDAPEAVALPGRVVRVIVRDRAAAPDVQRAVARHAPGEVAVPDVGKHAVLPHGIVGHPHLVLPEQVDHAVVERIAQGHGGQLEVIGRTRVGLLHVGIALHEQQVGSGGAVRVAVGHVDEVLHAVHVHQVPHVPPADVMIVVHVAGDAEDVDGAVGEVGHVAEVLERLGIALADHVGAVVAVKHVHQLPGIAVVRVAADGVIVVGHAPADPVAVIGQLVIIGADARRVVADPRGVVRGGLHGGDPRPVGLEGAGRLILGIGRADGELVVDLVSPVVRDANRVAIEGIARVEPADAPGLVEPEHLIRIVRHQGPHHLGDVRGDPVPERVYGGGARLAVGVERFEPELRGREGDVVVDVPDGDLEPGAGARALSHLQHQRAKRVVEAQIRALQAAAGEVGPRIRGAPGGQTVHGAVDEARRGGGLVEPALEAEDLLLALRQTGHRRPIAFVRVARAFVRSAAVHGQARAFQALAVGFRHDRVQDRLFVAVMLPVVRLRGDGIVFDHKPVDLGGVIGQGERQAQRSGQRRDEQRREPFLPMLHAPTSLF